MVVCGDAQLHDYDYDHEEGIVVPIGSHGAAHVECEAIRVVQCWKVGE
jgi:hypothetical protein